MTTQLNLPEDKIYVAETWRDHGGSFVSKLGSALAYADAVNAGLILLHFKHYVEDYKDQILERKAKSLEVKRTHA